MLELEKITLNDVASEGVEKTNAFQILSPIKSFIVIANSYEEKLNWLLDIIKCKEEREVLRRKQTKTDDGQLAEAPVWVPDLNATNCELCKEQFTLTRRRHHCRACGECVCGSCSPNKTTLTWSSEKVRVCKRCYSGVIERRQSAWSATLKDDGLKATLTKDQIRQYKEVAKQKYEEQEEEARRTLQDTQLNHQIPKDLEQNFENEFGK